MAESSSESKGLPRFIPVTIARRLIGGRVESMLAKGAVSSLLIEGAGLVLTFGVQILLARVMGVEQFGIYSYAITWLTLLGLFGKLGFDTAILRYLSAYRANKEWGLARGVITKCNEIATSASAVVGIIATIVVWSISDQISTALALTLVLTWLGLPLSSQAALRRSSLRALRTIVRSRLPDDVLRPAIQALLILSFWLAGEFVPWATFGFSAPFVMALQLTSMFIAVGIGSYWLKQHLPTAVSEATPEYRSQEWIRCAVPLFFFSGMHLILNKIDTVMIGFFLDTTAAGIYTVSSRIARLMVFGLSAVNFIAAPMISTLYSQKRMDELQRMLTFSARALFAMAFPICALLIAFGSPLLRLFGEPFVAGYSSLVILTAGQAINAFSGSVGYVMTMTGRQNAALVIVACSAVVNVLLNAFCIPRWGINGAAFATSITLAGWNIAFVIYVQRNLGLRTTIV